MKYVTIKDEEGNILPRAILQNNDKYGIEVVKEYIAKDKDDLKLVIVELKEVN
jgi:hypothetical protein